MANEKNHSFPVLLSLITIGPLSFMWTGIFNKAKYSWTSCLNLCFWNGSPIIDLVFFEILSLIS